MGGRRTPILLVLPAAVWLVLLLVLPLVVMLVFSFGLRAPAGGYAPAFTLDQYASLGARGAAFRNTLTLAPIGTGVTLLVAYPLAYWLALRAPQRWRTLLLVLVVLPFWTSLLIRIYAWIYLLGSKGIPAWLAWLGLPEPRLINTPFAVTVGIVYAYLPLMVFPLYVALERLDRRLLEASYDLGAPPWRTFLQVTLPLSMPGVVTGTSLVFVLLMGEFLIPQLLGGGKVFFLGNALVDLFLQSRNWPFGAAIATTLVVVMLLLVSVAMRLGLRREPGPGGGPGP
jgi:spermidine/putrescine transport system permease protein